MQSIQKNNQKIIQQKYQACMILSCVGDAMGYKNGDWQFTKNGSIIHNQMMQLTKNKGIQYLQIGMNWRYSDDTVMHIHTAIALINQSKYLNDINKLGSQLARQYKISGTHMANRAPGKTCMKSIQILNQNGDNWNKIPHNQRGAGCGGSMRSACIGLVYPNQKDFQLLIKVSIQAGRITHHNPIGYLGSMVASYFTSLALQRVQPRLWVSYLFQKAFPECQKYIKQSNRQVQANLKKQSNWAKFINGWKKYAQERNLSIKLGQDKQPTFQNVDTVKKRDQFYIRHSLGHWAGATGFDSVLIAYDALLSCQGSWKQFCLRGILHGGDNDSTGAIGGAWFGAYYGYQSVPNIHYKSLEDNKKLRQLGQKLYKIAPKK